MFHLAGQVFLGLIVGTLAKLIAPGKSPGGVIVTALVGLAGSIISAFVGHLILGAHLTAGLAGWILPIAGSLVALGIYRFAASNVTNLRRSSSAFKNATNPPSDERRHPAS